jgi:hypothetical protein
MEYVKKIISILQWLKVYHALDPCIGFKQLLGELGDEWMVNHLVLKQGRFLLLGILLHML